MFSCGKENESIDIDENQIILDSLSKSNSFIFLELENDLITSTDLKYTGYGITRWGGEDSSLANVTFTCRMGLKYIQFKFYAKEPIDKFDSNYKYKNFDDYCKNFVVGNRIFVNNANSTNILRGIDITYSNNYQGNLFYSSNADEEILLYSDFNFSIDKLNINYETQIIELYFTFNCELALFDSPNEYLDEKITLNKGHGKITFGFYKSYPL